MMRDVGAVRAGLLPGLALVLALGGVGTGSEAGVTIDVEVDARDLPRRLVHTRVEIPCAPGPRAVWYPKWIPGTHGKAGPIATVGGLRFEAEGGKALPWKRDGLDPFRVVVDVPEGVDRLTARLDTICNEATVERSGHLSFGNRSVGVLNWNTCVLYPEGPSAVDTRVRLTLRLPGGWKHASALKEVAGGGGPGVVAFEPVSLVDLIDSPLIAGENLKTVQLDAGPNPPAYFHVASESPAALAVEGEVADAYGRVVREAGALFGASHYPEYHFLVTCSDDLGYLGLEHHACSLNGVRERDLLDKSARRGWVANLIPHEYAHSWSGKYRRPAAMCTRDFQSPQSTELLWVYEGLGEYLGELLMVRSGLATPAEYKETLAATVGDLARRDGRRWRPLEDTAAASEFLRAPSANWNDLRRGQDYYQEGALVWMEADAILRDLSRGRVALDDFCRKFMGPVDRPGKVVPYDRAEIVGILKDLADYDWAGFFDRRVSSPQDALPLDVVGRLGYRVGYAAKPSGYLEHLQRGRGSTSLRDSVGMSVGGDGRVSAVNPGLPADRAGVVAGLQVVAVNGWKFSPKRLLDGVAASPDRRRIDLVVLDGERLRDLAIDYAGGPKYFELLRDPDRPDVLAEILKPKAGPAPK